MDKPRLLDLFCKAGGCTRGYQLAGFHVTGVDIEKQPHYIGDEFIQADVLTLGPDFLKQFDIISASPPCQGYSSLAVVTKKEYPKLINPVRKLLQESGRPYVIENVNGARNHLQNWFMLCGTMFDLKVYRHRLFETNFIFMAPSHPKHPEPVPNCGRGASKNGYITVAGHISNVPAAEKAMDIDWMNREELCEAIPPAYTQWIGERFLELARQL